MKIKQTLIKMLMITIVAILGIGTAMPIFAADENRNLALSTLRYIDGKDTNGYKLNICNDELNHTIYQIKSSNGGTNYYCLNAEEGAHWKIGEEALYNKSYDLSDKSKRAELFNDTMSGLSSVGKDNIVQILWVLENIYISNSRFYEGTEQEKEEERLKEKRALLAKAGLVYDNHDFYGNETSTYRYRYVQQPGFDNYFDEQKYGNIISNGINVVDGYVDGNSQMIDFTDDLLEVAQQAALWYFTNFDKSKAEETKRYDVRNYGVQLLYTENGSSWNVLESVKDNDIEIGKMQQDMTTILCWYLIDAAEKYFEEVKDLPELPSGNPLTITPTTTSITEKNIDNKDYYVVGPIKIKQNREAVYTLNNTIYVNGNTNTGAYISNANGNKKSNQIVKNYIGDNDFYIAVLKSNVNGENIQISFDGTYKTNKKTLWINGSTVEQPIVEVEPKNEPLYLEVNAKIENNKQFDLALRKVITGLKDKNGNVKNIINEKANTATRIVNINPNTIATTGTSTFNHRKDPVVVEKGDIIKYAITIYNEGDMSGYATTIVDKLPKGLALKGYTDNSVTTGTYTSGNTKYTYVYDSSNNTITFTNVNKNELAPFESELKSETLEIECEVVQEPSSTTNTYLANLAYITGAYNSELNEEVVEDRDSSVQRNPSTTQETTGDKYNGYHGGNNKNGDNTKNVYNDGTNNDDYFPGREDDDDFEIVVVKPAAFDLALQKYISKIYSADGKLSRQGKNEPTINTKKLVDGTSTTAEYTQNKEALKVKNGEYVLYTFNAYNEGDLDAFVTEITDNIPSGLQFVYANMPQDGKTVTIVNSDGEATETEVSSDIYEKIQQYNAYWRVDTTKDRFNGEDTVSIKCDVQQADQTMIAQHVEINNDSTAEGVGTGLNSGCIRAYNKEKDQSYDGTGLDKVGVEVILRVSAEEGTGKTIRNEAAITGAQDVEGNVQDVSELRDRDSQTNKWLGKDGDKNYQDDEDYDQVRLEKVDLALTKFIAAISDDIKVEDGEYLTEDGKIGSKTNPYTRQTAVNTKPLKDGTATDAIYTQVKTPLSIPENSYVLYDIRVYNEGDCDVYAGEVTDYLPNYLDFVAGEFNEQYGWKLGTDGKTVKTDYLSKEKNSDKKLKAFDSENDDEKGSGLDYQDLQILCKINSSAPDKTKLINSAEISKYEDENGNEIPRDVDSQPNNLQGKNQEKREQDDDDFEVIEVARRKVDLALTKFIVAISEDANIEDGEYLTQDGKVGSKTNPYTRQTAVNTKPLKDRTSTDAIYTQVKTPLSIPENYYVLYNIRVYNEADVDVYAGEVADYLPNGLDYVSSDESFNKKYGWEAQADGKTIKTTYLSKQTNPDKILTAFDRINDDEKGSGLDYEDLQILCKVNSNAPKAAKLINSAEITKYEDKDGNEIEKDVDSEPNNLKEKNKENREQDDDDYEVVEIKKKKVDLALTKFIAAVSNDVEISDGEYLTKDGKVGSKTNPYTRATSVNTKDLRDNPECHDATYNQVKTELTVPAQSYVLYDIRVYNEGETDVYAGEVTDHLPEYLEYVSCERNTNSGWKVASDGKTVSTDILSYENGTNNLLKAFDKKNDDGNGSGLDYRDLQVLCKVSDKAPSNTKIVNIAEISKYEDENGNDISKDVDVDSDANNVNEKNEDDDDYETVLIKTFDLSLLKYVTEVYVTEDGKTTTTQTGNTGDDSKDIIPKVEVNKKKLNSTVVKFGYTIKITNEGEIEGYAKEITDYVPQGLKFYSEDNEGWTDEGNNVISTRLLENTLLKPGESAEVKVILRWINGSDNLGLKINVAEISEDYNKEGVPDRDSTPDNKKEGEDDIDSAPVLLSIKTGLVYNVVMYATVGVVMLVILGAGIIAIKKFVL